MSVAIAGAAEPACLPNTQPLTAEGDLSAPMHEAAHRAIERKIAESVQTRQQFWHRDFSSADACNRAIASNRERFKTRIGVVDPRVPVVMERVGDDDHPALVADAPGFRVWQVRWPVLEGVHGEGLLLEPKGEVAGSVVVVPDAEQTPEQVAGVVAGVAAESQLARRLAAGGFQVVVPVLIDRTARWSGDPLIRLTNQPHREWIHRQAYQMGRHLIGYEVQKVLAAVDWFEARQAKSGGPRRPIGVAGYGEGGLIAFYAAACDRRLDAALVSGYFQSRQRTWEEPLYRNVWGLLHEFGDAEIAALIAPRALVIEYSRTPQVDGPPPAPKGQKDYAAPGRLQTPPFREVEEEFNRLQGLVPAGFQPRELVRGEHGAPVAFGSSAALNAFARLLEVTFHEPPTGAASYTSPTDPAGHGRRVTPPSEQLLAGATPDPAERQRRQVKELENHVQRLIRYSEQTRNRFFLYKVKPEFERIPWNYKLAFPPVPAEPFIAAAKEYRRTFWDEVLGRWDEPLPPPNPRTRKILDQPQWTAYEVVLDVTRESFTWGVLLVPKNLKAGERRPVVVCQHGRNGVPRDVIDANKEAYNNFAAQLAERGFITYAPHNLYRTEALYRMLSRKANTVKLSMFSLIVAHHEQHLNWLESLPFVDSQRIAFYGLSYGGETAVRVPPVLERYCLSICSGDFNDWTRKVASTDDRHSFMFTDEWEMPYFNMGSTFSYAELTYLMFPRPFMVERGHHDGVAPDAWVAHEYARTRWFYDQFGLGDHTAIEFFNGGHAIHGQGTFDFLHRHLNWPAR